jgi:hypothetical protein
MHELVEIVERSAAFFLGDFQIAVVCHVYVIKQLFIFFLKKQVVRCIVCTMQPIIKREARTIYLFI